MDFCTDGGLSVAFSDYIVTTLLPMMAMASIVAAALIGLTIMIGRMINNPKLTVWAKTEAVQLFVSIAVVFFIGATMNVFCVINMESLASIFSIDLGTSDPASSVFQAAETYLVEAAFYSHNAMSVARYHLEGYSILSYVGVYICDLRCLFGHSGTTTQPFGPYSTVISALNIFFNSVLMAHLTALNYLFLLLFVYKGFVFLFLPMGVFLRSMPYLRKFGSLLIAVAMSFLIVYPLLLSVLYLMGDVLLDRPDYAPSASLNSNYRNQEQIFDKNGGSVGKAGIYGALVSLGAAYGGHRTYEEIFFSEGAVPVDAIIFCAHAFIAAAFMPTVALIGTIASIAYIGRLMGEEINLSRITRMI